jgi:hypothetical protein
VIARFLGGAAALVLLAAGARDDPLAGRVAGPPQRCINLSTTSGPAIEEDGRIIYRDRAGKRLWVTRSIGTCPSLRPFNTLVVDLWGSQQCRNDRFRVVTPNISIPSAYCRFDNFVPYDEVKR